MSNKPLLVEHGTCHHDGSSGAITPCNSELKKLTKSNNNNNHNNNNNNNNKHRHRHRSGNDHSNDNSSFSRSVFINNELLQRNVAITRGVEDLTELKVLDETSILENFELKFLALSGGADGKQRSRPYTSVGDNVLVALNPCQSVRSIYDKETQLNFLRYNKTDLPAHAYAVSASAFWALHDDGRFVGKCTNSQSILIGGESGSGKSYTASILLEHLTATTATASGEKTQLGIDRIDAATECATESAGFRAEWHSSLHELAACQRAVLGSFGNTWTPSNDDSSRFTTCTKVFFSAEMTPNGVSWRAVGSEAQTCLLETSRVLGPGGNRHFGEKAFHVLYQMLHADEEVKKALLLSGKTEKDFRITDDDDIHCRETMDDDNNNNNNNNNYNNNNNSTGPSPLRQTSGAAWPGRLGLSLTEEIAKHACAPRGWEGINGGPCGAGALNKVVDALRTLGVRTEEKDELLRGLSAVLHLGQMKFQEVEGEEIHRDFGTVQIVDEAPLAAACEMLGCNKDHLRNALLTRRLSAGDGDVPRDGENGRLWERGTSKRSRGGGGSGEMLTVPLNRDQAVKAKDTLVKEVYERLFRWVVERTNASTTRGTRAGDERASGASAFIALLDMCGFENMEINGFEQLCKNYAFEKIRGQLLLQHKPASGVRNEHDDDRSAGAFREAEASERLLAMFEAPLGLIHFANDECLCPEGSDGAFVNKLLRAWAMPTPKQPHQQQPQQYVHHLHQHQTGLPTPDDDRNPTPGNVDDDADARKALVFADPFAAVGQRTDPGRSFIIKHFVGDVSYTADGLVEKNRGGVGQILLDLLDDGCENSLVGSGSRSNHYRDERRANTVEGNADCRRRNVCKKRLGEPALSQHRRQLEAILKDLGGTQVRRIVCVKPNDRLSSTFLDRPGVLRQLTMAGVSGAAQTQRLSFPSGRRVQKEAFFRQFRPIPGVLQRDGVYEALESQRVAVEVRSCATIQRAWRNHILRVRTATEWERYLHDWSACHAAQKAAQNELEAREQWELQWQHVQGLQRWQQCHDAAKQAQTAWTRGVFDSSHAKAVREVARLQEAIADEAEARRPQRAIDAGARQRAQQEAAEAAARRAAPPIAEVWPVDVSRGEENIQSPISTTPPSSPLRSGRVGGSRSSTTDGDRGNTKQEKLVVPRLAWLADDAMRAFLTEPIRRQHGRVRCRVTRRREAGWKRLAPAYYMHHIEDGVDFMMFAKRQPLSRTANFYISASPAPDIAKDTRFYIGKVRAHDMTGRVYTVFDNGIAPGRSSRDHRGGTSHRRELAGVMFSETRDEADGPRAMEAAICTDGGWSTDDIREGGGGRIADCVRERRRRRGLVLMRDRKPRYDLAAGAYVLDYDGHAPMPSIKNFQLLVADDGVLADRQPRPDEDWKENAEKHDSLGRGARKGVRESGGMNGQREVEAGVLLSFGKSAADEFLLDFRWPLSPVQAFGLALAALDTGV